MLRVALTGNVGSGKSAASQMLEEWGATVVDTDVLAREVVKPGSPALAQIREIWGDQVIDEDGGLDRAAMRHVAFADPGARRDLELILHPAILERAHQMMDEAEAEGLPDHEEEILKTMLKRGRQPNISFFAFTATPKYKTLEVFGTKGPVHVKAEGREVEGNWASRGGAETSSVENSRGDVRVSLPSKFRCRIDASAPHGRIETEIEELRVTDDGHHASGILLGGRRSAAQVKKPTIRIKSGGNIYIETTDPLLAEP